MSRVRGDRDDVFSHGFLCPKGSSLGHLHDDPDRLQGPVVRRDGEVDDFRRVGVIEAGQLAGGWVAGGLPKQLRRAIGAGAQEEDRRFCGRCLATRRGQQK